jgi:hypothetical protein
MSWYSIDFVGVWDILSSFKGELCVGWKASHSVVFVKKGGKSLLVQRMENNELPQS